MHEIESFAFANEVPWHGLGNQVSNEMSAQEMLEASGCDWEVQLTQNHYPPNHPKHPSEPGPKSYFIERMNDGSILGEHVVGTAYTPFQNIEMFNFFQEFLDKNQMYLHTAGSLYNGKKVFCMATTKEGFTLGKDDTVVNNLLFTINHTGTEANSALITPIRVVCANTMRLAMDKGKKDVVKHSHKVEFDAESMKTALGISSEQFGKFEEFAIAMAKRVLTGEEEVEFFRYVFGGKEREQDGKLIQPEGVRKALAYNRGQEFRALGDRSKKETKQSIIDRQGKENDHLKATLDDLIASLKSGKQVSEKDIEKLRASDEDVVTDTVSLSPTADDSVVVNPGWDNDSAKGTLWGAYQTVMFMSDHRPVRDYGDDIRLDRALYGSSTRAVDIKTKASNMALELVA